MSSTSTPLASPSQRGTFGRLAPPQPEAGPSHRPQSPTSSPLLRRHSTISSTPQHPGCVLCTLVASIPAPHRTDYDDIASPSPSASTTFLDRPNNPYHQPGQGSSSGIQNNDRKLAVQGREIVFHDEDITIYKASGKERLCADGKHLIAVINRHFEGVYDLVRFPSFLAMVSTRFSSIIGSRRCTCLIPYPRYLSPYIPIQLGYL